MKEFVESFKITVAENEYDQEDAKVKIKVCDTE